MLEWDDHHENVPRLWNCWDCLSEAVDVSERAFVCHFFSLNCCGGGILTRLAGCWDLVFSLSLDLVFTAGGANPRGGGYPMGRDVR